MSKFLNVIQTCGFKSKWNAHPELLEQQQIHNICSSISQLIDNLVVQEERTHGVQLH